MQPVIMRYWQQCETFDGTYIVDDLLDLMEMLEAADGKRS